MEGIFSKVHWDNLRWKYRVLTENRVRREFWTSDILVGSHSLYWMYSKDNVTQRRDRMKEGEWEKLDGVWGGEKGEGRESERKDEREKM